MKLLLTPSDFRYISQFDLAHAMSFFPGRAPWGSIDWNEERVTQQRQLAISGRAGLWVLLEGGPRHGSRGFLPHLEWPFFVMIDPAGLIWSFASPPEHLRLPAGARIVGVYAFDRQEEVMTWRATEGASVDIPSVGLSSS